MNKLRSCLQQKTMSYQQNNRCTSLLLKAMACCFLLRTGATETVEVQLELEMPAQLKKQLLDQYDAIHDDGKLVPLPRRPNVMQIFQNYVAWVKDKKQESQAEEDIAMGLQVCASILSLGWFLSVTAWYAALGNSLWSLYSSCYIVYR